MKRITIVSTVLLLLMGSGLLAQSGAVKPAVTSGTAIKMPVVALPAPSLTVDVCAKETCGQVSFVNCYRATYHYVGPVPILDSYVTIGCNGTLVRNCVQISQCDITEEQKRAAIQSALPRK